MKRAEQIGSDSELHVSNSNIVQRSPTEIDRELVSISNPLNAYICILSITPWDAFVISELPVLQ